MIYTLYYICLMLCGQPLCNLHFADAIDLITGTEAETSNSKKLQDLTTRLDIVS